MTSLHNVFQQSESRGEVKCFLIGFQHLLDCAQILAGIISHGILAVERGMSTCLVTGDTGDREEVQVLSPDSINNKQALSSLK